jgi:AcrR family transcriptional regulator
VVVSDALLTPRSGLWTLVQDSLDSGPMGVTEAREDQRRRVLDLASKVFADRGLDDVTMADIAAAADVSRATVFNYFGSKYALVECITETVLVFYRDMLDQALADETTPTADLVRRLFEDMGKGIESQRHFFRNVFREITRIQMGLDEGSVAQRASEETKARLVRLVERGQQRGDLSDDFDAETVATACNSLSNGTITGWLYHDDTAPLVHRMRDVAEVLLSPLERRPRRRS